MELNMSRKININNNNDVNKQKEAAMVVATAEGVKDVCKHKPTSQTPSLTAVLDSAATKHLIKDRALIKEMCPLPSPVTLILANKKEEQLTHGGHINIPTSVPSVKIKPKVIYAPSFKHNLISVPQLTDEHNAKVTIDKHKAVVTLPDTNATITAPRHGNLYVLKQCQQSISHLDHDIDFIEQQQHAYLAHLAPASLWHKRMGHIGKTNLIQLVKAVKGGETLQLDHQITSID